MHLKTHANWTIVLTSHPDVNGITFTGETRTGTANMQAAAVGIRPASLELGGKNAATVFADCDFDVAVDTVTRSCFENAGQVCFRGAPSAYVQRPIFDKFVTALKAKAEAMKPGRPFDKDTKIGPLVSKEHQNKVLSYYEKAKNEGATIVTGGILDMPADLKDGCWVQPTIWTGLPGDRLGGHRGSVRPVLPHQRVRHRLSIAAGSVGTGVEFSVFLVDCWFRWLLSLVLKALVKLVLGLPRGGDFELVLEASLLVVNGKVDFKGFVGSAYL